MALFPPSALGARGGLLGHRRTFASQTAAAAEGSLQLLLLPAAPTVPFPSSGCLLQCPAELSCPFSGSTPMAGFVHAAQNGGWNDRADPARCELGVESPRNGPWLHSACEEQGAGEQREPQSRLSAPRTPYPTASGASFCSSWHGACQKPAREPLRWRHQPSSQPRGQLGAAGGRDALTSLTGPEGHLCTAVCMCVCTQSLSLSKAVTQAMLLLLLGVTVGT